MSVYVEELAEAEFDDKVLKSSVPVVVDFWAPWCGPCLNLEPRVEKRAGELSGKVQFFKIDIDMAESVAKTYGIYAIPTLILFQDGREVKRVVGGGTEADVFLTELG